MANDSSVLSPSRDRATASPRRRVSRLWLLVGLGCLAVAAATALRFSPWAREQQLRRASLAALRAWAAPAPRDALLFYYLGLRAYEANSLGEAGYSFQKATELDPKMHRAFLGLAMVHRDAEQFPEAYAAAKQAQALRPRDPDTQMLVGVLVMNASKTRAVTEFQRVTQLAPRRADAWYSLGVCHNDINQVGEAIEAFKKAVELDPESSLYQRDLGQALLTRNLFDEARAALEKAYRLNPQDPQTPYLLGVALLKMARGEEEVRRADELFASAQKLLGPPTATTATTHAMISSRRAEIARRRGDLKTALKLVEEARRMDPAKLQYLYDLAETLRLKGDTERARVLNREYARRSEIANAVFQASERVKQDPKNPQLRLNVARLFVKSGDLARGINQYEYCLYLDPKNAAAKRELAEVKRKSAAAPAPSSAPR